MDPPCPRYIQMTKLGTGFRCCGTHDVPTIAQHSGAPNPVDDVTTGRHARWAFQRTPLDPCPFCVSNEQEQVAALSMHLTDPRLLEQNPL